MQRTTRIRSLICWFMLRASQQQLTEVTCYHNGSLIGLKRLAPKRGKRGFAIHVHGLGFMQQSQWCSALTTALLWAYQKLLNATCWLPIRHMGATGYSCHQHMATKGTQVPSSKACSAPTYVFCAWHCRIDRSSACHTALPQTIAVVKHCSAGLARTPPVLSPGRR